MADPVVIVSGLEKHYGGRAVVRGVDLRLDAGDMVGLVGANGAGKTTTLRMLAGMLRPDAGQGRVLGHDIRRPAAHLRSQIGYMGQRLALYSELTVAENLRFRADVHGLPGPRWQVAEAAARYGLENVLQTRVAHLSGGWARRVQFAATVIHAPPLLLLDEPTAGLDVATKHGIWRWLGELAAVGHAIVVSTHDLAEAERCPRILFYDNGRAHGPMTPAQMIAESRAATLEAAVVALAGR